MKADHEAGAFSPVLGTDNGKQWEGAPRVENNVTLTLDWTSGVITNTDSLCCQSLVYFSATVLKWAMGSRQ